MFDFPRVTSVQIFDGIKEIGGNPLPYALVAIMLVASLLLFLLSKFLFGRSDFAGGGRASMAAQTPRLRGIQGWLATGGFAAITLLAVLPHLGVTLTSLAADWNDAALPSGFTLQHYRDALSHGLTVPSILNSLKYAGLATAIDVVLGLAIAWIVVRTRLPGRHLLDSLAMLPIAVPGLVLAFGYLAMTREGQPFDWLIGPQEDPCWIIVIAYAIRRLPYVVRSASAGLQQTSVSLEEAAQNLGCTPWRSLCRIGDGGGAGAGAPAASQVVGIRVVLVRCARAARCVRPPQRRAGARARRLRPHLVRHRARCRVSAAAARRRRSRARPARRARG